MQHAGVKYVAALIFVYAHVSNPNENQKPAKIPLHGFVTLNSWRVVLNNAGVLQEIPYYEPK